MPKVSRGHIARQRPAAIIRHYLSHHRHSVLLAAIVIALEGRPLIGENPISRALFSIALIVLLLIALYTIRIDELTGDREMLLAERKRRSLVGWVLASVAIIERVVAILAPSSMIYTVGPACWFLFVAFITWTELRAVLRQKEITAETISMSISVYLLIGFSWGLLYVVVYQLQPGAFSFPSAAGPVSRLPSDPFSAYTSLVYFSLTTLTTMGFGDILPVTLQARYLAIAEGVMGIFYMAILVARLVGMQMSAAVSAQMQTIDDQSVSVSGDRMRME